MMELTGIPHLSLFIHKGQHVATHNGVPVWKTPHVNGCFLTFTKKLIDEVGYFKVLPYKYGHEHSNFTIRCLKAGKIPFYCDVVSSGQFLSLIMESQSVKAIPDVDQEAFKKNEYIAMTDFTKTLLEE